MALIRIAVDDVEVSETEIDPVAAVAAARRQYPRSMVMENRWLPMKRTALALNHLCQHPVPLRRLADHRLRPLRAYGERRRVYRARGVHEQGTNPHHALARPVVGDLRRHSNAQTVVLIASTDVGAHGSPRGDSDGSGSSSVFFDYPPHPRTIAHTVRSP